MSAARERSERGPKGATPRDRPEADTQVLRRPCSCKEAEAEAQETT
jgi:hypothetical protein